ncbi:XRE family transcriptional regulator [Streptomyces sp. CA-256286]|nr:XRE family transcriptional regulator [Streptomyces sp. CA-256286]
MEAGAGERGAESMGRPAGRKIYAHAKLRRLRRERGMNQVELARALGLSTSYLNQIEHSRRPLTAPVLLRIAEVFGVDPEFFSEADEERLATELRAALGDEACGAPVPLEEAADVARDHPEVARALVALHHRYRDAAERVVALAPAQDGESLLTAEPHDEVRDFFYAHHNHFGALDEVAERTAADLGTGSAGRTADALKEHLATRHRITVVTTDPQRAADARRFDPDSGLLLLSPWLSEAQRAFQLATQLALLEHGSLLNTLVADGELASDQAAGLARIGLANYFAGALLMPYTAFHRAAEELRYDIELLQARFGVGFETVCHRLSTLQRTGDRGVPFSFLRVDRAGNISKRQSASDFHFSRLGGTCPLWTVYEAFSAPGRILTQVAEMPDGKRYFWVARTVTRGGFGHRAPRADFAVALGCELRHAHRLVYAEGMALDEPRSATPIGLGCRICERQDCAQRARPPAGGRLAVDPDRRTHVPYPVVADGLSAPPSGISGA